MYKILQIIFFGNWKFMDLNPYITLESDTKIFYMVFFQTILESETSWHKIPLVYQLSGRRLVTNRFFQVTIARIFFKSFLDILLEFFLGGILFFPLMIIFQFLIINELIHTIRITRGYNICEYMRNLLIFFIFASPSFINWTITRNNT